ncbi:MAG: prolipoprotein diacylglyceryl transferase [Pseudomonadota bacterium]|uniref:prolipoprotein diacylglyceryl transferase n=1 Tax=Jannaschia sp. S6380 TaxID=2926408 RepID=UPI001FF6CD2F|nr:prolipoprotein diacylglyceryl transferase [Jannaschia sp. S6380]MCK0166181.1 prolipoprotein diacylglyceryl transferase [Jannaschia sp. S6380]
MTLLALPFPEIGPDIFSIDLGSFTFALRWYAMAYIAGIVLGWWLCRRAVLTPRLWGAAGPPLAPARLEDLVTWIVLGVILGGRLGFVLFYQPGYYLANPAEILMVWQGGMSFHGGMLGVAVALILFHLRHRVPLLPLADLLALATPIGLFLGRLANFVNAELWGRPTDLPWAVIFPGAAAQDCAGVAGLCARHPSQLYEALLEGVLLGAVLLWLAWRRGAFQRPGLLTGVFLMGYGTARALVELVRQPDAQFAGPGNPLGYALQLGQAGLTMGQILSLPMIAAGLWLALRAFRGERLRPDLPRA